KMFFNHSMLQSQMNGFDEMENSGGDRCNRCFDSRNEFESSDCKRLLTKSTRVKLCLPINVNGAIFLIKLFDKYTISIPSGNDDDSISMIRLNDASIDFNFRIDSIS